MIDVKINGEVVTLTAELTISELLASRQLLGKRLAVERNGEIVPKGRHSDTRLQAGDCIEIVVAVGGG